jgi:hypothetical protein
MSKFVKKFTCAGLEEYLDEVRHLLTRNGVCVAAGGRFPKRRWEFYA